MVQFVDSNWGIAKLSHYRNLSLWNWIVRWSLRYLHGSCGVVFKLFALFAYSEELIKLFSHDQLYHLVWNAEVVQVLQDLENVCSRVVCAPLDGAMNDLRPMMSSPNLVIRNRTYMLILRYLKDNPHAASDLLPDYLDCLDNRNASVVTSALDRLPDFLLLCQGSFHSFDQCENESFRFRH